jgi:hypothetical protein
MHRGIVDPVFDLSKPFMMVTSHSGWLLAATAMHGLDAMPKCPQALRGDPKLRQIAFDFPPEQM